MNNSTPIQFFPSRRLMLVVKDTHIFPWPPPRSHHNARCGHIGPAFFDVVVVLVWPGDSIEPTKGMWSIMLYGGRVGFKIVVDGGGGVGRALCGVVLTERKHTESHNRG